MRSLPFFILLISSFSAILFAQTHDTLWTKTFGGSSYESGGFVRQTNDGGYIIVGSTESFGDVFGDIWLIKTNANGDTTWTKILGGPGSNRGACVQQTTDGGYIIAGETDFFNGPAPTDLWLIKTDANGDTIWTKEFGGSSFDWGSCVQQTSEGGYIIAGFTQSFGAGGDDIWLVKTDANGDSLWTKTFGGTGNDEGLSVQQTVDGGYIITGHIGSYTGRSNLWLIKTDAAGDTLWTKIFGENVSNDWDNSVQQTSDCGYIITGGTNSYGSGNDDVWLIKTNANGNMLWNKTFGGSESDYGTCIQQTSDGGYIIAGATRSFGAGDYDLWLIKVDSVITAIDEYSPILINTYHLGQNYPNPFNPTTTINYQLATAGKVEITIYNLLGQQIRTLVNAHQSSGAHQVQWDGRNESGMQVTSGIYFYKLKVGSFSETKKMILLR